MHESVIRRGWANENEESKAQKIDFIFRNSELDLLSFDPINDQICY